MCLKPEWTDIPLSAVLLLACEVTRTHEGHVMFFPQHGAARVGIYCVCCAELVSSACVWELREDEADH